MKDCACSILIDLNDPSLLFREEVIGSVTGFELFTF